MRVQAAAPTDWHMADIRQAFGNTVCDADRRKFRQRGLYVLIGDVPVGLLKMRTEPRLVKVLAACAFRRL